MNDITILVADNNPNYLSTFVDLLKHEGYQVETAASPDEAKQKLEENIVHLAILDLRLTDDRDEHDKSGLMVAKKVMRSVPKLIMTTFPTVEVAVEALRPDMHDLPPAVDFCSKRDDPKEIMESVQDILERYVDSRQNRTVQFDQLRQLVEQSFDVEELRVLYFDLDVPYDHLMNNGKSVPVINLIEYFRRRNLIHRLIEACHDRRPFLDWQAIYED